MARPIIKANSNYENIDMTIAFEDEFQDICLRTCFLPGIFDKSKVKESFTSSTFTIEIHSEDIHKRSFHERNIEEYIKLAEQSPSNDAVPAGKPPAKGKGPPIAAPAGGLTPFNEADKFLIQAIDKALSTAGQIRPHGAARFR